MIHYVLYQSNHALEHKQTHAHAHAHARLTNQNQWLIPIRKERVVTWHLFYGKIPSSKDCGCGISNTDVLKRRAILYYYRIFTHSLSYAIMIFADICFCFGLFRETRFIRFIVEYYIKVSLYQSSLETNKQKNAISWLLDWP